MATSSDGVLTQERMLITVRTYPNLSVQYGETVCTGAITEGKSPEWRRLYPVLLRDLEREKQFRTFDVIRVKVREGKDGRPETRRPHLPSLTIEAHLDDPAARWEWIRPTVFDSLEAMKLAGRTLAPVRVSEVLEFVAEPASAEWTSKEQEKINQQRLFEDEAKQPLEKVPFNFRLRWRDGDGIEHDSKHLSWEVGQTYRNFRQSGTEGLADRIRSKWMQRLTRGELVFFMGNFAEHRQHFGVCGLLTVPTKVAANESLFGLPS